jgi:hypothetical protein
MATAPVSGTAHCCIPSIGSIDTETIEPAERTVDVRPEFSAGRVGCRWQRSDHQRATHRQSSETLTHQMPKPPAHPVANHRVANCLTHDKAHPGRLLP